MTPKQERFVAEYLVDLNATQAAIRAGFSEKTAYSAGSRLLKDVEVASRIAEANKAVVEKAVGSAEWIVEKAVEVVERALHAVPVRNAKGEIIEGEWDCDLRSATPALTLLAKRHKEFSEKHVVSGDPEQPIIVERRTRSTR